MLGALSFLKQLFFLGYVPQKQKKTKPVGRPKTKVKLDETGEFELGEELDIQKAVPWWRDPVQKDESAEFEEIQNTVLYDELELCLKESRLEVIELPETISAVLGIIHRRNFRYEEVIDIIERSPALTGDFLSIVNSAAFSRGIFIHTLDHALPRLGRTEIQSILYLNASKMSVPETPLFHKVVEEIIQESQAVAKISRILASRYYRDQNEAFLAGLLHNIGKIGLLKQISKHYNVPEDLDMEYHQSIFRSILPDFAGKAGEKIGQYWKLSKRITRVLSHYNKLNVLVKAGINRDDLKIVALVNLSVYIARILGFGMSLKEADLFNTHAAQILNFHDTPANRQLLMDIFLSFSEEELAHTKVA